MVIFAVLACVLCCIVWTVAVIRFTRRPRRGAPTATTRELARPREEDRIRPALDAEGQPIWVDAQDLFWHEIVAWPLHRDSRGERQAAVN
jgi:hypothetical protein